MGCTRMVRKPRVHFAGAFYHVMYQRNHSQSIFKEPAKELHQDPAVLSRLAGELASKPELRGVVETLHDSLKERRQRIKFALDRTNPVKKEVGVPFILFDAV
jgi:hypothetical protein